MEKKILMITSTSKIGGGPKQLMLLASGLQEFYEVNVACPPNGDINKEVSAVISGKLVNIEERKLFLSDVIRLIFFVKKFSINVIHSHGKGASILGRLTSFFTGVPLIHTYHGIHIKKIPKLSRLIYIYYERLTSFIDFYDIFVSNTEFLEAFSYSLINHSKYLIIPNGVQNQCLTIDSLQNRDNLRKQLKIPTNKITIITVCRLEKIKNLFEFIDIASLCPLCNFLIVGGGDLAKDLQDYIDIKNLNNIRLTGFISNPTNYFLSSDIYLSTSFREGHPISILEAMSFALPVIATDVTGNKDTIIHEKSGFFYQIGSTSCASKYIQNLANDIILRRRLGIEALGHQRKFFSSDTMVSNYLKVYSTI